MDYPLYDIPYLVREHNDSYMSAKRHQVELRNQAVVDDYFLSRANGATANEARDAKKIPLYLRLVLPGSEKKRKIRFL